MKTRTSCRSLALSVHPGEAGMLGSMTTHRWPAQVLPVDRLGAVVHGPLVLGRSAGVVAALRCVFAFEAGLHLFGVLRCEDGHLHLEMSWPEVGLATVTRDVQLCPRSSADLEPLL